VHRPTHVDAKRHALPVQKRPHVAREHLDVAKRTLCEGSKPFSLASTYVIQPSHWPTHLPANQVRRRWGSVVFNVRRPYLELVAARVVGDAHAQHLGVAPQVVYLKGKL
jgi:hypothetical protein